MDVIFRLNDVWILRGLSRWAHRLRLYYFYADPGPVWALALRPFIGVFFAPVFGYALAEVRLYLQLGLVFSGLFLLLDLGEMIQEGTLAAAPGLLLAEFLQNLLVTYAFVNPITFWNALGLVFFYIFGRRVEMQIGSRAFLKLLLLLILVPTVLLTVIGLLFSSFFDFSVAMRVTLPADSPDCHQHRRH